MKNIQRLFFVICIVFTSQTNSTGKKSQLLYYQQEEKRKENLVQAQHEVKNAIEKFSSADQSNRVLRARVLVIASGKRNELMNFKISNGRFK